MSTGGILNAALGAASDPGVLDPMTGGAAAEPVPAQPSRFDLTRDLNPKSPLYAMLKTRITERVKLATTENAKHHARWQDSEERVLAYLPESDADLRRAARRRAGEPTYTTIQIPYTFAQVMAAHTYWTTVFLSRSPIHQVIGRHGEGEMQIEAMEALLAYQMEVGRAVAPYFLWFYDAAKYGVGWLGSYWCEDFVQYTTIEQQRGDDGKAVHVQVTRRTLGYNGNRVYNISPYDALPDPRVTVNEFQKGEFFGVRSRVSWNEIVRRKARGMYTNLDLVRSSRETNAGMTSEGSPRLERPMSDWEPGSNGEKEVKHPSVLTLVELYVELIPSGWGLGESSYPEKWVFTITADLNVLIGAMPLGAIHGEFPIDVLSSEIEGYGTYNRGIPEVMQPVQETMDWLLNSHMWNVRSAVNLGFIIDPTKIVMKDVEKGGPGFVWRLRPEAYGKPIDSFYKQVQINDVTQNNMADLQAMFAVGERVFGVNDQMLGMLAQGGRKTATEVRTSTGFGVNRLKTIAEWMSATGFAPHAQKLIMTSQQYYTGEQKLRRVGDLAQFAGPGFLNVTPDSIAGQFDLIPVDGALPIDRFAQVTVWKDLLSNVAQVPQVMMQYDLGRIFAWVAQLAGIKNLDRFKIQPTDPMALAAAAQAGNVVPIRSGGMGNVGEASAGGSAEATLSL